MSILHSFTITNMVCQQTVIGRPDFVGQINITVTSIDVDNLSTNVNGTVVLLPSDSFTPFNELTESEVNSWIESSQDYVLLKEAGERALLETRSPPIIIRRPPWLTVTTSTNTSTETVVDGTTSTNTSTNVSS